MKCRSVSQVGLFLCIVVAAAQFGCPATPTDVNSVTATPTTATNDPTTSDEPTSVVETDPTPGDSDGDGFSDDLERNGIPGSDPFDPNDTPDNPIDTDGDGCSDFDELNFANFCDNDPNTQSVDPGATFSFSLTVARHVDQPFTDARLDSVFGSASSLLQTVETECPDVATQVVFERDGSIVTFDMGDAVVTTEAALDTLFSLPQDIKIVNLMIGVCGLSSADDLAIILGCAATAESLVIVEFAAPDVWAHEWGHVQGLNHRDDCPRNLMHAFEVDTNAVNDLERNAFLSSTPQAKTLIAAQELSRAPAHELARLSDRRLDRSRRG